MAGYVSIGNPIVKTGIVNETAGIGAGKFVEMSLTDKKVTIADDSTELHQLYFTVNVTRDQYLGDTETAVKDSGAFIDCAALEHNNEIFFTVSATTGYEVGTLLVMGSAGILVPIGTTAGDYKILAVVESVTTLYDSDAIEARMVNPYVKTVTGG